jgi:hypothetical protein
MRVFFGVEIVAEVFCRDGVPEAGGGEGVVGVHFVLDVALLIIDFFKIINDFYISLDRGLLLAHVDPFPHHLYPLLPLLRLLAFFLSQLR